MSNSVPLSSYQPFIITGNIRLQHRYPTPHLQNEWIDSLSIRVQPSHQLQPDQFGRAGDVVLGELHPSTHSTIPILDHTGTRHLIHPSTPHSHSQQSQSKPVRLLAVLGNRESNLHVNGGVFNPQVLTATGVVNTPNSSSNPHGNGVGGDPSPSPSPSPSLMPLPPGLALAWLGEESGLVGHLISDTMSEWVPAPMKNRSKEENDANGSQQQQQQHSIEFVPRAATFVLIGLVHDRSGQALNIRSLAPIIPPQLPISTPQPKLILVGSTSSSLGKTSLAASIIQALHALTPAGSDPPRISFVKFTGTGSLRECMEMSALRTVDGRNAVVRCVDHVDVGMVSTYSPPIVTGTSVIPQFKTAIAELLAIASAPVPVSNDGSSSMSMPVDFIVGELGSDIIWSNNPILLSLPSILSSLIGLFVITNDALSILGSCSYLHGTLKFPPSKLLLFNGPQMNFIGMLCRIRGSEVQLYQHSHQQIIQVLHQLLLRESQQTATNQGGIQASVTLPTRSASNAHTPNGSISRLTINTTTPVPMHSPHDTGLTSSTSTPSYHLNTPLIALPTPTLPTDSSPALTSLWSSLIHWSLSSIPTLSDHTSIPSIEWSESEVAALVLNVSHNPALQHALNFQSLVRRRDRIRTKRAKDEEEAQKKMMEASLGMLAGAKTTTSGSMTPSSNKNVSPASSATNPPSPSILHLGDYESSPFYLPPSTILLQDSLDAAATLLEFDHSLALLRRHMVPARVTESVFWTTYFAALSAALQQYLLTRTTKAGSNIHSTNSTMDRSQMEIAVISSNSTQ